MTQNKTADNQTIMEGRYQRAQNIMQGIWTKKLAFNTTLIPRWIGNSDYFWYDRELKNGKEFRLVDASSGSNECAFDHVALSKALAAVSGQPVDAEDLPISKIDVTLSPLQLNFSAFGKRWVFNDREQTCAEQEEYPDSWLISPDGRKAAFIRDDNLWLRELSTDEERPLTQDGEPFYRYASTPSAAGIKVTLGNRPEALWSPDSRKLFTLQMDTRAVKTYPIIQHVPQDGSMRPTVTGTDRRVAFPGDNYVDEYRFLAIDVNAAHQQEANYRHCAVFRNAVGFFTYRNGWWGKDNRRAYFIDLERGDHVVRLVEFDTHTGATRVVIEEEIPDTCFKLHLDSHEPTVMRPIPNRDELIWYSERSGWAHLYLYDLNTGALKHPHYQGKLVGKRDPPLRR